MITTETFSASGIAYSAKRASTCGASPRSKLAMPPKTSRTGCSRNSSEVATPKFPPAPRSAQNRSLRRSSRAVSASPSAVTMSARSRLSAASPCLRARKPCPPPSVKPATPTVAFVPETGASPKGAAASITSPQVAPGPTRAVRRSGSTNTERMRDVSTSSVSGEGSTNVP